MNTEETTTTASRPFDCPVKPLPCPFCGSEDVGHTDLGYREFVVCNVCGAMADSADTLPERTPLEVWNMRFNAGNKPPQVGLD